MSWRDRRALNRNNTNCLTTNKNSYSTKQLPWKKNKQTKMMVIFVPQRLKGPTGFFFGVWGIREMPKRTWENIQNSARSRLDYSLAPFWSSDWQLYRLDPDQSLCISLHCCGGERSRNVQSRRQKVRQRTRCRRFYTRWENTNISDMMTWSIPGATSLSLDYVTLKGPVVILRSYSDPMLEICLVPVWPQIMMDAPVQ